MRLNLTPRRLGILVAVLLLFSTVASAGSEHVPVIAKITEYFNGEGWFGSPHYAIFIAGPKDISHATLPPNVQPVGNFPMATMADKAPDGRGGLGGPGFSPMGGGGARPAASTVRAELRSVVKQLGL